MVRALEILIILGFFLTALMVAGVPGYVAKRRHHPNIVAIQVLGYLGLITGFITWLPALIWAVTGYYGMGDEWAPAASLPNEVNDSPKEWSLISWMTIRGKVENEAGFVRQHRVKVRADCDG